MIVTKIFWIIILTATLIVGCSHMTKTLKEKQSEKIILGSSKQPKELKVAFPFEICLQNSLDSWRCTANQPYCITYKNDSINVSFCHLYNNFNNAYFSKRKKKIEKLIHYSTTEDLKQESKKYRDIIKSEYMKPIIKIDENYEYTQIGFVIKWKQNSLFKTVYKWVNESEYLTIEFRNESKKDLANSYLKNEIDFIVNNLKGKPVHNM